MAIAPPLLVAFLLVIPHPAGSASALPASSPFDAALVALQARVGYSFRAPGLLRRAGSASALPASSPFDAALVALQARVGYSFRAPGLLRRAMTHASYSRDNGRALAVLGLAAAESAAALRALDADSDATASAVSRRARDAASEAACAAAGTHLGIPAVVRVAGRVSASSAPVVCGALRALIGAVAVDANSTDAAGEVFWRLHVLTAATATAAM